jgi:hypothetical protein
MAFNGTGANVTTLNAANISSGTLAVGRGGTGATTLNAAAVIIGNGTSAPTFVAPGSNGNVLVSNGTAWTSAAPAGGGVTSLNGETGAITNTTLGNIGSVVQAFHNTTSNYTTGSTISGSNLYYASTISSVQSIGTLVYTQGNNVSGNNTRILAESPALARVQRFSDGNTGYQNPTGMTTLSGTWRCMYFSVARDSGYDGCVVRTTSYSFGSLWVRVS